MASTSKSNYGLTPGEVMDTPIDYTTSIGWKQWEGAIRKLSDELYDGSLDKMRMLIKKLKYRASATGWSSICEINGKCIFNEYGKISIEECIDNAKKYYVLESSGKMKETRDAQMSQQMITCIRNSISDECALKMENSGTEPAITIKKGTHEKTIEDGPMFLKIMISRITIDSRSTVTYIRSTLSDLDKHMMRFDCDVTQFNDFVKTQIDALQARGETSYDIMVNLFKGYKAITDSQFKQYIAQKINEYDEGSNITKERLMNLAENKYKTLIRAGEWKTPDEDQKEVLALRAQIEDLKAQKSSRRNARPDWKKIAPSDLKEIKMHKNREYNWCPKHQMWTVHKAEDCKLPARKNVESKGNEDNTKNKWQLANALVAMQDGDDSSVE